MKVDLQGIADRKQWEDKGYHLPEYDIGQMREATKKIRSGYTSVQATCSVPFMPQSWRKC